MKHERQDELSRLLAQPNPPLDAIEAIVLEQCDYGDHLFSGFISVFAEAMDLLGHEDRIVVTSDNGGRVVEARRK